MRPVLRTIGAVVGVAVLAGGVYLLRESTISRHTVRESTSRLEVLVDADLKGAEPGQALVEHVRAKAFACRTEVALADPVGDFTTVTRDGEELFRFVLQPSLDDTDRRQFRGCMQDWNMDHVQIDVVSMLELSAAR